MYTRTKWTFDRKTRCIQEQNGLLIKKNDVYKNKMDFLIRKNDVNKNKMDFLIRKNYVNKNKMDLLMQKKICKQEQNGQYALLLNQRGLILENNELLMEQRGLFIGAK